MVLVIGEGSVHDKQRIPLATRKGRDIPNVQRWEMNPQIIKESEEQWKMLQPDAGLRALHSRSNTYNCMGLVFASRRTCIDTDLLEMIAKDDEYEPVDEKDTMMGDLVLYCDEGGKVAHIGIIVQKVPDVRTATFRFTVLSKWGFGGEYIHPLESVPAILGRPIRFITDRGAGK